MSPELKKNILLVEDEALIAVAEKMDLEKFGYTVHHVTSGEKAVQAIREGQTQIDLILMDIDLGRGMDGTVAAENILAIKDIPVVFLSSHVEPEIVEKTEKITSYGYVVKNSGIVVLDTSIKMALRLFQTRTELQQVDTALGKSEANLSALINNQRESIWSVDDQFNYLIFNDFFRDEYHRIYGIQLETGVNALEVTPPQIRTLWEEKYKEVLGGKRLVFEFSIQWDGNPRYYEVSLSPIRSNDRIHGVSALSIDITDRKKIEDGLKASEERARRQRTAISELTLDPSLTDADLDSIYKRVCEVLSRTTDVARASIWELTDKGKALTCLNLYDSIQDTHSSGVALSVDDIPNYFKAILAESRIYAEDVLNDPRTMELAEDYLIPLGISSMLDAGIVRDGRLVGVVCSEHIGDKRRWLPDEESFSSIIATFIAQIQNEHKRKRAEDALVDSQHKLAQITDNMTDVIWTTDMDLNLTYISPSIEKLTGYSAAEYLQRDITERHPESSQAILLSLFQEELVNEQDPKVDRNRSRIVQVEVNTKEGLKTTEMHVTFLRDPQGNPIGVLGAERDITRSKEIESSLKDSQTFLQSILDNSTLVVFVKDLEGRYILTNQLYHELFGTTHETVIGKTDHDLFPTEHADAFRDHDLLAIRNESPISIEESVPQKDGLHTYITTKFPLMDSAGHPHAVCGIATDISERKKAERDLYESEVRLRNILENSTNMFYAHTPDHILTYVSPQVTQILGYSQDEAMVNWTELVSDNPINELGYELTVKAIETGESQPSYELELLHKTGRKVYVEVHEGPVVENGKTTAIVGALTDITKRKLAEAEIQRQLSEKEVLLREVHHRVKNNMANIEALLSLQANSTADPEVKAALKDSISRIHGMQILYKNLLISGEYREISVKTYVERIVESLLTSMSFKKNISTHIAIADFEIDPKLAMPMGIIINELLTNAFKYAFKGRTGGSVDVTIEKQGQRVVVRIKDDGVGISDEVAQSKSSGFGLMIVRMLVEQLDGKYSIVRDKGTLNTFEFEV